MYGDDPNSSAAPGAIPPIDPSLAGNPDAPWVPPWLTPSSPSPMDPYQQAAPAEAPGEIEMPDEFVGRGPAPAQPAAAIVPDVNPDAIVGPPPPWLAAAQHAASSPKLGAVDYALSQELGEPTSTGEDPGAALHQIAMDPQASISDRQLAWKQMSPEDRANVVNTADPKQLAAIATAAMSPDEIAKITVRHQQAQIHEQSQQQLVNAMVSDQAARRDYDTYQQALLSANAQTQQLAADAQKIAADAKVDPNEHGVLGFLANVVLSGIGGAMSQFTGGRNLALEELDKKTQRRIDAQTADIANRWKGLGIKQNLIAENYRTSGDLYHAQEAYRISQYDRATSELQTQMQDFDPAGTTALRGATMIQQIQAQRGAALAAANQQFIKNHIEQQKAQNEADTLKQTVKHQNDETAIARGHLGIDYSKNARDQKEFDLENAPITPEQARLENPGLPDAAYPKTNVTRKVLKSQIESYNKGLEAQGKANENAQKQSGGQVLDGAGNPYVKDGKPVQIDPEVAKDLNKEIGGGQGYIDEMSKVKRMLAADPSTFDRDKWAELNSHLETAAAQWTKLYGAKASSRELEAAKEVVGANYEGYASRVKDKGTGIAAIGAQIDSTKRNLNTELKRRAGITGGADLIDTSEPPPTKETPEDKLTKVLSTNIAKVDPVELDADDRAFQQITRGRDLGAIGKSYVNDHFSPVVNRALETGVAPSQQRALDQLQAAVRGSDDAARKLALDVLGGITGANIDQDSKHASATGANPAVRAAAQAIIDEADAGAAPAPSPEMIGPATQVQHETLPEVR